jgi:hypothetical protein
MSDSSQPGPRTGSLYAADQQRFKTPEPISSNEQIEPIAPRQPRLRVRRRNFPNLTAPTEHFLASVAAADVAILTIEVNDDADMMDTFSFSEPDTAYLTPNSSHINLTSPPKTPVPQLYASFAEGNKQRPDWSNVSNSADGDFSRPESVLSDLSDHSDDSFYGSHSSRPSDGSCTSPDSDAPDPFTFPSHSRATIKDYFDGQPVHSATASPNLNNHPRHRPRRTALWTKEMSSHLWSVYQMYLQDPTVTPFRIAANAVPPEGVCYRVAREAKRSWKGPRSNQESSRASSHTKPRDASATSSSRDLRGGSLTPTAASEPKHYAPWPHSKAATRQHLRDLCKLGDTTSVQRHRHMQSRSPTPFTKFRVRSRRNPPPPYTPESASRPAFATKEISMSLVASTAESMQPDGPLAQLAREPEFDGGHAEEAQPIAAPRLSHNSLPRRLGSPFVAHTYGPSSSKSGESYGAYLRPSQSRSQLHNTTSVGPSLLPPPEFERAHSWNTQKRRAQYAFAEELSEKATSSSGNLTERLFGIPPEQQRRVRNRGFSLGDEHLRNHLPGLFMPPENIPAPIRPSTAVTSSDDPFVESNTPIKPSLLPSVTFGPSRHLNADQSESGDRNTFPRRLFALVDGTATIKRRGFATSHFPRHSIDCIDFVKKPQVDLQGRLNHLDEKLAEIHQREAARKRSKEQ